MNCNPQDIFRTLGKGAYTKVRSEIIGTSSGVTSSFSAIHDNFISGSTALYTSSTLVPTNLYSVNYNDGKITSFAGTSGSVITLDYDYSDMENSAVIDIISQSDKDIEDETGRVFNSASTTEYLDVDNYQKDFFLKNYPVITLSSVSQNTSSSEADVPSWSSSSEGLGNDYLANSRDLEIGRIRFIDNFPLSGKDRLKVEYTYGFATTPANIKELSVLLSIRQMMNSSIYKAIFDGNDNFTPVRLNEIEARIEALYRKIRKQDISSI